MKYQAHTICFKEIAPHVDTVVEGWDRLSHTPTWTEFAEFRETAILNGGLDRYWGPYDQVIDESDMFKRVIITYNTLEAALEWYDLVVDVDGYPIHPTCVFCKIVEFDEGKIGELIKASVKIYPDSDPIMPPGTNPK
jgi:hypothetical protein